MFQVIMDRDANAISIEFESGVAGYAEELDSDRIVDYSKNPGDPIGVSLHNIHNGVSTTGLPRPDLVRRILTALDVPTKD